MQLQVLSIKAIARMLEIPLPSEKSSTDEATDAVLQTKFHGEKQSPDMILVLHQIIFLFNKMYNRTQRVSYPNTTLHDQSYKYKTFVHPSNTLQQTFLMLSRELSLATS